MCLKSMSVKSQHTTADDGWYDYTVSLKQNEYIDSSVFKYKSKSRNPFESFACRRGIGAEFEYRKFVGAKADQLSVVIRIPHLV